MYDVCINVKFDCDGNVYVNVVICDLWILLLEISFSCSGGENELSFGFCELNFLGWGKCVLFLCMYDVDCIGYLFVYDDFNIFLSCYCGWLEYFDNDDGKCYYIDVSYLFFFIDIFYSYGVISYFDECCELFYYWGDVVSEFE